MNYYWDFSLLLQNYPVLWRGVLVTVQLWFASLLPGLVIGLATGLLRLSNSRALRFYGIAHVEVFRNTPVLVQLIWFYFAFPIVSGIQPSPFMAAVLALGLNTSAYCAEIFRSGIQSIPAGQWEGAKALAMSRAATLRRIILPQVMRSMLPAFTNRAIELAKVTSLASVITVHELMYQGRLLSSTYYRPLEMLTTVAIVYFLLIYPGSLLSARIERRLARQD